MEDILEIGIGTCPNLKYCSSLSFNVNIIGVDTNRNMEKLTQVAAEAFDLPQNVFEFTHAV